MPSVGQTRGQAVSPETAGETWQDILVASAADVSLAREVCAALQVLLAEDAGLFVRDVHERTITARLADHLRRRFPGWDVDSEYNRDGHEVKKANGDLVVPDVIVHHRGTPDNLLVIEAKKSNTREADEESLKKLDAFKACHLQYRHALFVKFIVGTGGPGVERLQWV
jgi:hypothetical protein